MKEKRVCLIDDDETYLFLVSNTIRKFNNGLDVIAFSDAEEAFNYISENADKPEALPNVIMLDLNMPIMDGWAFLEEYVDLKPQLTKKIIIYIVTSSVDETDFSRAKAISDVTDFIIKPVTTKDLAEVISVI